jgi:hemoglobin
MHGVVMNVPDQRARLTAEIVERTGIDEELIHRVVHEFYARVRKDALLGPIFDARVKDWSLHLERMCAFWSSVALMSGRYHGRPMEKHLPLPVDAEHFDRWLTLFEETVRAVCAPPAAEHFLERAQRIAESLELGIAGQAGVMLAKGARFVRAARHDEPA